MVAVKGSTGKSDGTASGKCARMTMVPNRILTQTPGNYILLASGVRGHERHHSCHPPTESKEGQGQHLSTFRFCSGITQLSPALFHLGQELWNHKRFHAPVLYPCCSWSPLSGSQGAPSTSAPQLPANTQPWLCISVVSWLLVFQPGVCLGGEIKV